MKSWKTTGGSSVVRVLSGGINAYLLTQGEKHLLIDTGIGRNRRNLRRRLGKLGIMKIDLLVITHAHYDHAGNAAMIRRQYGAKVLVHRTEAGLLESAENAPILGTIRLTRFLAGLGARHPRLLSYPPCRPDILVDERYDLASAGFDAYVLHTPGHTPGSTSVIVGGELALVGDALFGVAPRSIFPPFASDRTIVPESWKKLLETGCRLFLPAHGRVRGRKALESGLRRRSKA